MKILVKNGIVIIDGDRRIDNGAVLIENNKIIGVFKEYQDIFFDEELDVKGNYIIPGLIETHTHGCMGYDFNTCKINEIEKVSDALLKEGVTCFMASLTSERHEDMLKLLDKFDECKVKNLLGVHVEGPFLNTDKPGVIKVESLKEPEIQIFDELLNHCTKIKSMTIAPELPNALHLITYGNNKKVVMNVGHSNANANQVMEAQRYGAKGITHLYNAMSQHLHRNPGVVTGAFISNLFCEMIVDGFHIDKDIVNATYKIIGKDRIVLICDANPCKGLPDGNYQFSGKEIVITDGKARVKDTGRIAGSTLTLNEACRNMIDICGCTINDAIKMAATNPAKMYGLQKGKIEIGYDGDIAIVNDEFNVLAVINQDKIVNYNLN